MESSLLYSVFNEFTFKILLFKFFKIQKVKGDFNVVYSDFIRNYKDDKSFYLKIKNLNVTNETEEYNDHEMYSYVARNYSKFLKIFIKPNFVYLDIGCGTGFKACKLASDLSLNKENVHGTDISHWALLTKEQHNNMPINFKFMNENSVLPYEENSFDFVSLFMVLHHVKNINFLIDEILRILKKDGILIIREHDVKNIKHQIMTDAEHHLYDYIKIKDYDHLENKEFFTKYYSIEQWKILFKNKGLKLLKFDYDRNFKRQISPTRAFHMVLKK